MQIKFFQQKSFISDVRNFQGLCRAFFNYLWVVEML